ncbi:MAG: alpha-amylase [Chloroflexi bacterium]|nr:alpha-amylase [Chloroflexota bacterium]
MKRPTTCMEFHISRQARDRYQFNQSIFSLSGNVIFADFYAARIFAQKMNEKRDLIRFPEEAVRAGQINAMGLIDEILHFVIEKYRHQINPIVMGEALDWLVQQVGEDALNICLQNFADQFPPLAVYRRESDLQEYLDGSTGGVPNKQIVLEEMLMLWLANMNPAFSPHLELFDDTDLEKNTAYPEIIASLKEFFETQPKFGPDNLNLIDLLRRPAIAVPHSLSGQLDYMRQRWGHLLGDYIFRLLSSLDFISEEDKAIFQGPGPARVYDFTGLDLEIERFSPDSDWMPSVVLIAKNIFVWLDQLSKQYQRPIYQLDHIPDEELDRLASWGFKGLWLIGLWERSSASQRIKQLRGNPEAVASAYSLSDYQIAAELGGEESYRNLHARAWQRGLRLASDMVPNHMGIDSNWVIEHPEWFVSLDYSPFPAYSFSGVNLSWDERVGIYIEDHYYDNTDAAVVFKRMDNWTGNTKYIYHGNDGTSMPWNDTAQLNYLLPEVREAVVQSILGVARKFPIIRFDAAMTLAKKHYQRLWYPEPGTGGAIPSRAEHGLTKEQFEAAFPVEFWREVVDRVAEEVPDTLLLAEAFWLMEGYFVRTLGMHRVYNSAFMNMLRDEKNQEYRLVIKNTLEFDPEILKRYVNFMNNPDERTAVDQFGKEDKYFGICILMSTLPGLPMFGHGQIEGFAEKYGMEFRRAYWEEKPDPYLVERHEREIFPLLRKRYLFVEVGEFSLYDFFTSDGHVNEDVYAYSNRCGDELSLVVYHNRYADARGWIKDSAASSVKTGQGDQRQLVSRKLHQGLGLHPGEDHYTIFRDQVTGLEYIRNNRVLAEEGLYLELGAYKYHVFLDFRQVQDNEWHQYAQLTAYLDGRGVPSVEETLKEIILRPIHFPFRELAKAEMITRLLDARLTGNQKMVDMDLMSEVEQKAAHLLVEINKLTGAGREDSEIQVYAQEIRSKVKAILELPALREAASADSRRNYKSAVNQVLNNLSLEEKDISRWSVLIGWAMTHNLGRMMGDDGATDRSQSWIDEWLLGRILVSSMTDLGLSETESWRSVGLMKILIRHQMWYQINTPKRKRAYRILERLFEDEVVRGYLQVNRYQGILWFNKEAFEELLVWMMRIAAINVIADKNLSSDEARDQITGHYQVIRKLKKAESKSEYQVEKLLEGTS